MIRLALWSWLLVVVACAAEEQPFVDNTPPSERSRIFYLRNGTLGKIVDSSETRAGVDIADADCTAAARDRGFDGAWRAWLSSSTVDAITRLDDAAPWYRTDRETLLFATKAELVEGPRATIEPPSDQELMFWSGTSLEGTRTSDTCADWTIYVVPAVATVGRADAAHSSWVVQQPLLCSNYLALLCIEQ